jgi:hypothetical protein
VARLGGICAASAYGAQGRSSHNPPVVGSSPTRPTCRTVDLASTKGHSALRMGSERIRMRPRAIDASAPVLSSSATVARFTARMAAC